ncbi:hypothetical protein K440DRAFT_638124 [Wilcoxina mikolae CBS 423.85]|nr:hypothetical protein K440DRAFT_638124 [Wilcoxina mikolae CBS 423.85]
MVESRETADQHVIDGVGAGCELCWWSISRRVTSVGETSWWRREACVVRTCPDPPEEVAPSAFRKQLLAQLLALRAANRELELEIGAEEARVANATPAQPDTPKAQQALVYVSSLQLPHATDQNSARLLAANDSSITIPPPPLFAPAAEESIPSARPFPIVDPLPQLRAFSTLTFSTISITTLIPGILRRHTIKGYAGTYGVGVLDFTVDMVIHTAAEVVEELSTRVSPWARTELGEWLTQCGKAKNPNSLLYGLVSYYAMCLKRAKVFAKLSTRYQKLVGGKSKWAVFMGREVMVFRPRAVEFVLLWRIQQVDVDEVESVVRGEVRVPAAYREFDDIGAFAKVPGFLMICWRSAGWWELCRL